MKKNKIVFDDYICRVSGLEMMLLFNAKADELYFFDFVLISEPKNFKLEDIMIYYLKKAVSINY